MENHMLAQRLDTSFPSLIQQLDHVQSPVRGAVATPIQDGSWGCLSLLSCPLPPAYFTDLCMHTLSSWFLVVHMFFFTLFLTDLSWQCHHPRHALNMQGFFAVFQASQGAFIKPTPMPGFKLTSCLWVRVGGSLFCPLPAQISTPYSPLVSYEQRTGSLYYIKSVSKMIQVNVGWRLSVQ